MDDVPCHPTHLGLPDPEVLPLEAGLGWDAERLLADVDAVQELDPRRF